MPDEEPEVLPTAISGEKDPNYGVEDIEMPIEREVMEATGIEKGTFSSVHIHFNPVFDMQSGSFDQATFFKSYDATRSILALVSCLISCAIRFG